MAAHKRGRGFLGGVGDRKVTMVKESENESMMKVTVGDDRALNNWDPMRDAYNDKTFNSYSRGLGNDLNASQAVQSFNRSASRAPEPGKDHFELYITGIPRDMNDEGLKNLFLRAGTVKKAKVMEPRRDVPGRNNTTFGFVGYQSKDEIQKAIQELDNFSIRGSTLRVRLSKTKEEKEADARRQAEQASINSEIAQPHSRSGSSGYESSTGRGPRDMRNTRGNEPTKAITPPRPVTDTEGGGDAKPRQNIVRADEQIEPGPCVHCGKMGGFRCKNCKVLYCGLPCQREDWKKHRKICAKKKTEKDSGNESNKENDNIIKGGPMAGFSMDIDDDIIDKMVSPTGGTASQKKDSRMMYADVERERLADGQSVMVLSSIQSPVSLTFGYSKNAGKILELGASMKQFYGAYDKSGKGYVPIKDELVAAYFEVDDSWNRARVLSVADGLAQIKFVDYGNECQVPFKQLRRAHEMFKREKLQGVDVLLANCVFTKEVLSESDIAKLGQILVDSQEYRVTDVYKGGAKRAVPFVKVTDMQGVDVGDKLAAAGLVVCQESSPDRPAPRGKPSPVSKSKPTRERFSSGSSSSGKRPMVNGGARPKSPVKQRSSPRTPPAGSVPAQAPTSLDSPPAAMPVLEAYNPETPNYLYPTVAKTFYPGKDIAVTFVGGDETRLWIQVDGMTGFLEDLTTWMTEYYKNKKPKRDFKPSKNCLVAARFPISQGGDDRFYRAHVFNCSPDVTLDVRYLDYSNKAQVTCVDIQNMEGEHLKDEFQAVPVHLQGLDHSQAWSPEVLEQFTLLVTEAVLKAKVVSNTNHFAVLDVTLPDGRNLSQVMMELGVKGVSKTATPPAATVNQTPRQAPQTAPSPRPSPELPKASAEPVADVSLRESDLKDGSQVALSHLEDLNNFFVQADARAVESVQRELTKCRSRLKQFDPSKEGQLVVALSPKFNDSFRGRVLKLKAASKKALVYYVDYGNKEGVPFANLFMMPPKLAEFPELALHCSLGVQLIQGKVVEPQCFEAEFTVKVGGKDGNLYTVDLINKGKSLRESLVGKGVVEGAGNSGKQAGSEPIVNAAKSTPPTPSAVPAVPLPASVEPPKLNEALKVMLTDAGQFDSLYVQILDPQLNDINGLSEHLNSTYPNAPRVKSPPNVGDLVVAKFSQDQAWYRAVVKTVGEVNAYVQFIDYGNMETVSFKDMCPINDTAAAYKIQAVRCYLQGVSLPPGAKWDPNALPIFTGMSAVFLGKQGDKYEIQLFDEQSVNQAEALMSRGLVVAGTTATQNVAQGAVAAAPKCEIPPFYAPSDISQPYQLLGIDMSPAGEIYVIINEGKVPEYIQALESMMKETYEAKEHKTIDPQVGEFVVARYSLDQSYYRALVQDITDGKYSVLFVDYGNTEVVIQSDIKPVVPELLQYPRLALKCCFENCVTAGVAQIPPNVLASATHLLIKSMTPEEYQVDLLSNGSSIREQLLAKEVLQLQPSRPTQAAASSVPASTNPAAAVATRPSPAQRSDLLYKDLLPNPVIKPDQACLVIHVESPTEFYVQLHPDGKTEELLVHHLPTYCETKIKDQSTKLSASDIQPGLLVAGKFEGTFYRGVVKSVGNASCDVCFFDFGNSAETPIAEILPLDKKFASCPPMAIRASNVHGVRDQTKVPLESLGKLMETPGLTLKRAEMLADGSYKVALTLQSTGEDVSKVLQPGPSPEADIEKMKVDQFLQEVASKPHLLEYMKTRLGSP